MILRKLPVVNWALNNRPTQTSLCWFHQALSHPLHSTLVCFTFVKHKGTNNQSKTLQRHSLPQSENLLLHVTFVPHKLHKTCVQTPHIIFKPLSFFDMNLLEFFLGDTLSSCLAYPWSAWFSIEVKKKKKWSQVWKQKCLLIFPDFYISFDAEPGQNDPSAFGSAASASQHCRIACIKGSNSYRYRWGEWLKRQIYLTFCVVVNNANSIISYNVHAVWYLKLCIHYVDITICPFGDCDLTLIFRICLTSKEIYTALII